MFTLTLPFAVCAEPQFTIAAAPSLSNDGRVVVSWESPSDGRVHIQHAQDEAFSSPSTLYRGNDSASVITGLVDGEYFYRGRMERADGTFSDWSPRVNITVEHHSLFRALSFFLLGCVVFVATLLLIILGAMRHGTDA
ncbi:MAG: fibronectin type III domain-containing protein [Candidatus Thiodiazotropha sp.]